MLSSLLLGKEKLREAVLIVRPETLVGWHRAIVRRHWTFRPTRKPGRPSEITPEMEQWVLRIAGENPGMGYGKIAGEMRKLGFGALRPQQRGADSEAARTHAGTPPEPGPGLAAIPRPLRTLHLGE